MTYTTALKTSRFYVSLSTPYTLAAIGNAGQFVRHALHTTTDAGYKIVTRLIPTDELPTQACRETDYWQVSLYDDPRGVVGWPWPAAVAFVRDATDKLDRYVKAGGTTDIPPVELQYMVVIDRVRREGFGTALFNAINERWPGIEYDTGSDAGEAFVEAMEACQVGVTA